MGDRSIVLLSVAGFLADAAFVTYLSWTPKFLLTTFAVSGGTVALVDLLFGVANGVGALGTVMVGFLFERVGGRVSATVGGVAATMATLGVYFSSSLLIAVSLVVAGSFFLNWFWSLITVMSQAGVPVESRAASTSLVQTWALVGAFIGPGLAGALGGAETFPLVIAVVVPNALFTLVMALFYRDRRLETRAQTQ
jgi:MFS family permease